MIFITDELADRILVGGLIVLAILMVYVSGRCAMGPPRTIAPPVENMVIGMGSVLADEDEDSPENAATTKRVNKILYKDIFGFE